MNFISGLHLTPIKKDSVLIIVDRLTKSTYFISVRTNFSLQKLAKFYISEIVRLHRVPITIISDRDPHFTSQFWKKLHEPLGILGPGLVSETEDNVCLVRDRLKAASDRQKSYANLKCRDIEYSVEDFVFLKLSSWKKVLRFDRNGKLLPFHILKRVEQPPTMEEVKVQPDLAFEEEPVQILDGDVKVLRRRSIPLVKVLWLDHSFEEATLEPENTMHQLYSHLF
ncbi:uncharacterized protein [Gossypium hirsutum]|uniref:Uncharacterized protein n=1 Tax=Gossypium hirsutum TaxID=3635 RepID=A0A1U8PNH9_GOSHI|nr:uncharacterized protein LOC107961013 [Gossypium hirsutum]